MARARLGDAIAHVAELADAHEHARDRARSIAEEVHAWCDLAERYATLIASEEQCT